MSLYARITHRQYRQQIHPGILSRRITRRGAHEPITNGAWTAVKTEYGYWTFTWKGGSGSTYDIWLNGERIAIVTGLEYIFKLNGYDDTPPPIEIVCNIYDAENEIYPPYARLQWREVAGAAFYIVERYVDSIWRTKHSAKHNGSGYHTYKTPVLDDQTEVQYRVTALNSKGHKGTPVSFTFDLVRNPDPPEVEYEIDESNDLAISAVS